MVMKYYLQIAIDPELMSVHPELYQQLQENYMKAIRNFNTKIESGEEHMDSGFDLFIPFTVHSKDFLYNDIVYGHETSLMTIDHHVKCAVTMVDDQGKTYPSAYYMFPRSSISKTPLRLANSVGIIDSGYRGNLIAKVDFLGNHGKSFAVKQGLRLFQVCNPLLRAFDGVELLSSPEALGQTTRGSGGFGSTD
jgi:dUTPase